MSVCLSLCLVCLFSCLSAFTLSCLAAFPSVCLYVCPPVCLYGFLPARLPVCMSVCLFAGKCLYFGAVGLSVCLSVGLTSSGARGEPETAGRSLQRHEGTREGPPGGPPLWVGDGPGGRPEEGLRTQLVPRNPHEELLHIVRRVFQ